MGLIIGHVVKDSRKVHRLEALFIQFISYLDVVLANVGVFEKMEYTTGKNCLQSITPQITSWN